MTFDAGGFWEIATHVFNLALAYALALPVGWDRERDDRSAGSEFWGGLPTEARVAQLVVGNYAEHQPLYREAQMVSRQRVDADRFALAN